MPPRSGTAIEQRWFPKAWQMPDGTSTCFPSWLRLDTARPASCAAHILLYSRESLLMCLAVGTLILVQLNSTSPMECATKPSLRFPPYNTTVSPRTMERHPTAAPEARDEPTTTHQHDIFIKMPLIILMCSSPLSMRLFL